MIDWLKRLAALAALTLIAACNGGDDNDPNVLELAKANPNLTVLVEAVTAADLTATLSGPGPYTVFAPTDAAFAALLAELGITEVVRGADLIKSTFRQLLLFRALGFTAPASYHCPLVTDAQGMRLAKRHDALALRTLREQGRTPEEIRAGWLVS